MNKMTISLLAIPLLGLSACADNYAVEGAAVGAGAGAILGASTGMDDETAAGVGAAAGAVIGSQMKKDNDNICEHDRNGRPDDDC